MQRYSVDPNHSQLHFDIDHLAATSTLTVRMAGITGTLSRIEDAGLLDIDLRVDALTVSSGLPVFEPILAGESMFDLVRFKTLSVEGRRLRASEGAASEVTFGIRDRMRSAPVTIQQIRTGRNRRLNKEVLGLRFRSVLARSAWGMDVAAWPSLSDEIRLLVNIEAIAE